MTPGIGQRLRAAGDWIDARSLRERALVAVAALALVGGACSLLVIDPLSAQRKELSTQAQAMQEEIVGLQQQAQQILATAARDPNQELRQRADALRQQIGTLDTRIREHTLAMVSPAEMSALLERMLLEVSGLELARLENLGAEPLIPEVAGDGAPAAVANVYKHRFEVVVQGSYLDALHYLLALEALPSGFFWESLEYEVRDHPDGVATIRAYTLSSEEGWVGA